MYPDEENVDEMPDSPPHVPVQYMNGHRGWHIVIDNGQEVIELVTSDEEDEPDPLAGNIDPVPVVNEVQDDPAVIDEPMVAFWAIAMQPEAEQMESDADTSDSDEDENELVVNQHEIGIQCTVGGVQNSLLGVLEGYYSSEDTDSNVSDQEDYSSESENNYTTPNDTSDSSDDEAPAHLDTGSPRAPSLYVCGGRGRYCHRGRASSSMIGKYLC